MLDKMSGLESCRMNGLDEDLRRRRFKYWDLIFEARLNVKLFKVEEVLWISESPSSRIVRRCMLLKLPEGTLLEGIPT